MVVWWVTYRVVGFCFGCCWFSCCGLYGVVGPEWDLSVSIVGCVFGSFFCRCCGLWVVWRCVDSTLFLDCLLVCALMVIKCLLCEVICWLWFCWKCLVLLCLDGMLIGYGCTMIWGTKFGCLCWVLMVLFKVSCIYGV